MLVVIVWGWSWMCVWSIKRWFMSCGISHFGSKMPVICGIVEIRIIVAPEKKNGGGGGWGMEGK